VVAGLEIVEMEVVNERTGCCDEEDVDCEKEVGRAVD
jgi:hypothetical protein